MLTRRHVRIKVIQSVYAFSFKKNQKLEEEIKFFKESIANIYNLHLLLLALFKAIYGYTLELYQIAKKSKTTSRDSLLKLEGILANRFLEYFSSHPTLDKLVILRKIKDWETEFKYVKRICDQLLVANFFEEYMQLKQPKLEDDRRLTIKLFQKIIAPAEYLYDYIEDRQLTWQDDLPLVNTFIFKQIKDLQIDKCQNLQLPQMYENQEEIDFGLELLKKTISKNSELQEEFRDKTPNWEYVRIAQIDAVILKTAIAELLYFPSIPPKVTMNEYLEVAKDYSTPKSNSFVNGVLDRIVRELGKENRLNKSGRGLL